jgi:hypothetical protein
MHTGMLNYLKILIQYFKTTLTDGLCLTAVNIYIFGFHAPYESLENMKKTANYFKGIVSRDFVVCFLVSFVRSDISTHQE